MAVRQIAKSALTFSEDTHFLEFPRSDGDKSQWPSNTKKVVDKDGAVNYMSTQTIDGAPSPIWRRNCGMAIAKAMGLAEGHTYVLKDWPKGYGMFIHLKGPEKRPRNDPYLYGSTNVLKFRSSNEFAPHAIWLFSDDTLDHSNCICKYSTKKPQLSISQSLGLRTHQGSPSLSQPSRIKITRPKREVRTKTVSKPYNAVRKALKPAVKRPPGPQTAVVPERDKDIRDSLIQSDIQPPRLYRAGEVIWCRLNVPIQVEETGLSIEFWPGVVDDVSLKIETSPRSDASASASQDMDVTEEGKETNEEGARTSRRIRERVAKAEISWTVRQRFVYNVKLLATTSYTQITDLGALPYLAYSLESDLVQRCFQILKHTLQTADIEEMNTQLRSDFVFDPYESADRIGLEERVNRAVIPYTLAVETAKNITCYWTPTDQFDYTFTIPSLPPNDVPQASTSGAHHESLHTAIEAAMTNNAKSYVSGAYGKTADELREAANVFLGTEIADQMPQSRASTKTITQSRYQGLWWGAERLWQDELVRLKLARNQFAPSGAPAVNPPSGLGADTAAAIAAQDMNDAPEESFGAGDRGMFMRIEGLFVADVQTPEGMIKECRASGMIYELADVDWEPPAESENVVQDVVQDKGKGRAIDAALPAPSASQPGTPVKGASSSAQAGPGTPSSSTHRHYYDLPTAPTGFKFNPILPLGHEVVLSLSLISGRYYPDILRHPLLEKTMQTAMQDDLMNASYLWALQGSVAGVYQSMDPQHWKKDRHEMLMESTEGARAAFAAQWASVQKARLGGGEQSMPSGSNSVSVPDVTMSDAFDPSLASGSTSRVLHVSSSSLNNTNTHDALRSPAPSISSGSASSSSLSLNGADEENATITAKGFQTAKLKGTHKSTDDIHMLATSTRMTELSYAISDIQTRIFEIQELRHNVQPTDTVTAPRGIDQSLATLDERLEIVSQGIKAVNETLEPLLDSLKTPTPSSERDNSESGVVLRKHFALLSEWETVQKESQILREELKEDKWLTVFRTVTEQADGMMASLEKAVNRCQDFIYQIQKYGVEDGTSAASSRGSTRSEKTPLTYEVFTSLFDQFEAKKKHYMPATAKVLSIIDKGVQDRVTKNGECLRRHAESTQRWRNLQDRITRTETDMEKIRNAFLASEHSPSEIESTGFEGMPIHLYVPVSTKDPLDNEVAMVVNSLAHSLVIERVDPPLKTTPKEGEEIRAQYAFASPIARKIVTCKLTTLARSGGKHTTKKVMCRVGGGWQDLNLYIINRQSGI
ncbi:hypothetical protein EUX98_g1735 [Antrodiella citrinella]|uniref:GAR domain-containing protein n=1 Tax=Antrodiella citrinella TaxID=2447956 RepID=A0A4S4N325_9APHY|nr:hypothetical protein EUX98_g1735 [Antrodiella citrinella]